MGDVIFLVVAGLKLYGIFVLISIVILFFAGVALFLGVKTCL